ncbi:MetQ/NlpA family ABC transporter substrate-binding protein [Citricoccus muralis]|uniref:MetQ/NlpA family ABC transporter substrate-binding protein n=1 Tax=Citricoccus muralis TaxID=169134 RepID=A0ABY8H7L8_9MICC|nr:MetQ/NlpA family ABC transporter substrate-binding protein [Citricoccus muralis]WFP17026.1 MetQ/NlpA family ABC transporter substrate-binding protein [Citricoccus muralis]
MNTRTTGRTTLVSTLTLGMAALLTLSSCGLVNASSDADADQTISMIVTESAPYQDPTEIVKEQLEEQGWTLETTYVTDIVLPNEAVNNGEYDVNFFQHQAYLRQFNQDNGTEVESLFSVYYTHSGIFSLEYDSLDELPDGAQVAIPVDTSNNGRALKLLAEGGVIEVDETKEVTQLSQRDITANPKNIEFIEIDQQSLGQSLPDVDAGFGFIRSIADAGYDIDDTVLLLEEDPEVKVPFTVVVAAQPEFRDTEAAQVLQEAYQSEEVQQWYDEYLGGGVVTYEGSITVESSAESWAEFSKATD